MSRITIEVKVNTDPVPGWGYDPWDYVKLIQRQLDEAIPHYKPEVDLVSDGAPELDRLREQVNSGLAYRESVEGLPEGTLPRV